MDWADDVPTPFMTFDDFYRAGLIPLDRLRSDRAEIDRFKDYLAAKHGDDPALLAMAGKSR